MEATSRDNQNHSVRSAGRSNQNIETIGFVLLPEFSLYGVVPAIEALRVANQNYGSKLYNYQLISVEGSEVAASNRMNIPVDGTIATTPFLPTVIVCAGNQPTQHITKALLNWLRRLARHGAAIGAIDTGAFTLAAAGLLEDYRVTLHWEAIPTFREAYPDIDVIEQVYVIDRDRMTCAGGTATLDMMLDVINERHGLRLAQIVANGFVHSRIRQDREQQRIEVLEADDGRRQQVQSLIQTMEENLDSPLSPKILAKKSGISVRRMQHIFRSILKDTPMSYYLKIRLQAARNLLFYSDLPIHAVSDDCGFSSPSVFSRTFRSRFGRSPRIFREESLAERMLSLRPEISEDQPKASFRPDPKNNVSRTG